MWLWRSPRIGPERITWSAAANCGGLLCLLDSPTLAPLLRLPASVTSTLSSCWLGYLTPHHRAPGLVYPNLRLILLALSNRWVKAIRVPANDTSRVKICDLDQPSPCFCDR
ncbi:hypothetical protein BDW75DRAFT_18875 [Aspergillus navahoensis]